MRVSAYKKMRKLDSGAEEAKHTSNPSRLKYEDEVEEKRSKDAKADLDN